jgi:hypothetical protein
MTKPVRPLTKRYLERCGYSPEVIAGFTGDTRLFQDIGLFGGNAYDELRLLERDFEVDFSSFPFQKYFVTEKWGLDHFALVFLPMSNWASRVKEKYPPITLDMVEQVIAQKRWIFD